MPQSRRGFKAFDHTADLGFEVWGDTFESIFEEAASALFSVITDLDQIEANESRVIELRSTSGEELFLSWLKELLFLFEKERIVFSKFKIEALTFEALKAVIGGEKLTSTKHPLGREVKAVTDHQLLFRKTKKGFLARFIIDI
ncbi:MAG: archease [Candidatus Omnitrophica bacterium CG11_big_fil_rev_8_21_14_0_20_45_26]|uniref:Archease n=1 Tax=Candidatus Abzuiibacterium crystallinum TaxID=1974748 RepID=A0A2H0LMU1_9BACT|nr:MAG: archease [Candidatus Omnitrophica bacterium CG11_big_fil_rev_8_21_14_0_20_45_26]PIW64145.1 MAG: archease [Candidatus Omnitrophica bacterium CG12_big_fil_rev_8_21_14_0_65_45_16]